MKYPAWSIASVSGAVKTISRPPSAGSWETIWETSAARFLCLLGALMNMCPMIRNFSDPDAVTICHCGVFNLKTLAASAAEVRQYYGFVMQYPSLGTV